MCAQGPEGIKTPVRTYRPFLVVLPLKLSVQALFLEMSDYTMNVIFVPYIYWISLVCLQPGC
jgi:hypothetical protein